LAASKATAARGQQLAATRTRPDLAFDSVKVFSATMFHDRQQLGEQVTGWIAERPEIEIADIVVRQSSDASFHMIAIVVFFRTPRR